ncbi:endonuclease/exonuclease/phosphatase family protein [Flavobacteriaceae bacterium]|jgi:vancomycin resistance protein VanJ|nr:endonuclease/exonuclease/phosphatase family protein [Flavobacteriaceae bacterium]
MKNLNFIDKLIFFINSVLAILLLFSYLLQYLKPSLFPYLSLISLFVPALIIINLLFFVYWLIKLKKQFIISLLILLLGYSQVLSFFNISTNLDQINSNTMSVMSYNVRLFNLYNWIDGDIISEINSFIDSENPDIINIQEFSAAERTSLDKYPYKYSSLSDGKTSFGLASFSKLPIVNQGVIKSVNYTTIAIFIDVEKNLDTIRFYNIHLKSFKLESELEILDENNSDKILNVFDKTFKIQENQSDIISNHIQSSPYKVVLSGDFNNTAHSYVYKFLKGDLVDSFYSAGNGFGRTYNFKYFPMRIDFILMDSSFRINNFKTFKNNLSDHFPIISIFNL